MKKTATPTEPQGIRLPVATWPKLRAVMQHQGRAWLERAIEREFKKISKGAAK